MAEAESGQSIASGAVDAPAPAVASLWSRRDFFGRLGWGGFTLITLTGLLAAMRSAFPRVLFAPDTTFKAGPLEDFVIGEVNEKFKSEFRVWIVREPDGFYALYATCTHLGCTPELARGRGEVQVPLPRQRLLQYRASTSRDRRRGRWSASGSPCRRRPARGRRRCEVPARERRVGQAGVVLADA